MKHYFLFFFLVINIHCSAFAQDAAPSLAGRVNISVKKGLIECDFILKNMPPIAGNYVIRINSGMNIRHFKKLSSGELLSYDIDRDDTLSSGESLAYYFRNDRPRNDLLKDSLQIRYTGMFPVIDSASGYTAEDWRGNIAFTHQTLRADGLQSAWYPILYDMSLQKLYKDINYDITINCADCSTLYVNGSKPVKAQKARFQTSKPQQAFIYVGDYDIAQQKGVYLLNPGMNVGQQREFAQLVNSFKQYLERKLKLPYKGNITFIQTTPTASPNHAFLFVAYPTITNVGIGKYALNYLFNKDVADHNKHFIAHELGHYYFGALLQTNTDFGAIINEGFTEYLAHKLTRDMISDSMYSEEVNRQVKALNGFKTTPPSQVKNKADFKGREFYVRYYIPLMLIAIEKEIGEDALSNWLNTMLTTPTVYTDYSFLKKTFYNSISDKLLADRIVKDYFESANGVQHVVSTLSGK